MLNFCWVSSFILYLLSTLNDSLVVFWFIFEAASLLLIPCFFYYSLPSNRYNAILNYLLISGFSSCLIVGGFFIDSLNILFSLGVIVKLGLFPVYTWVFLVYCEVSWLLLFLIAVVSKVICLFLVKLNYSISGNLVLVLFSIMTLFSLVLFFLSSVNSFKSYVAISSIGSSSILAYSISNLEFNSIIVLYFCYFFVNALNFTLFYLVENMILNSTSSLSVSLVTLSFPFSFAFLYKLVSVFLLLNCNSLIFLIIWLIYGVVEQFYLYNLVVVKSSVINKF